MNFKKLSFVALILAWSTLIFYWILKLFFGYQINLICTNEKILAICNFVDNNLIINYLTSCVFCSVFLYLYYCIILRTGKLNKRQIIATISIVLISNIFTYYGTIGGIIADCFKLIITPIFILNKINWKTILATFISLIFNFLFQLLSVIITNIGFKYTNDSLLLNLFLSIDLLIMLFITLIYRKENIV